MQIVEAKAGKDAADHIAAGHTLDELVPITDGRPKLWQAADLKPAAQPRWLAKHRIPRAAASLIIGEEGIGKSLLWVWLIAAVTTGAELPGFGIPARDPGRVLIAAVTEDDWSTFVRPRLEVAGADLSMIDVICTDADGSGAPVFPRDMPLIREPTPNPTSSSWTPGSTPCPPALNVRDPQQARLALHPWKDLATVTDAAMTLVCHTNRIATPNARDRYGATVALRKKARMTPLLPNRRGRPPHRRPRESQRRRHRRRRQCSPSNPSSTSHPPKTTTAPCPRLTYRGIRPDRPRTPCRSVHRRPRRRRQGRRSRLAGDLSRRGPAVGQRHPACGRNRRATAKTN